jgi:CRISPR-associated protein Cas6
VYWQEESEPAEFVVSDEVVDLAFAIKCRELPVDHGEALFHEIARILPWFRDEPRAGLHTIHGAESGNGWERPQGEGVTVYLSRRTPLVLRLPQARVAPARALEGETLQISGYSLEVGPGSPRLLSKAATLYARYVAFDGSDESEEAFMQRATGELRGRGFRFKKILCGKAHYIATASGPKLTRSLMVGDLSLEDSVRLQQEGLGLGRKLGCGLFMAHKSV